MIVMFYMFCIVIIIFLLVSYCDSSVPICLYCDNSNCTCFYCDNTNCTGLVL